MDSCKQIYKYLIKQNNQVVELITRGQSLRGLEKAIFPFVNQHIKSCFSVGEYTGKELILLVSSADIANKLRYQSTRILSDIRKLESFNLLESIKVKVVPKLPGESLPDSHNNKKAINHSQEGSKNLDNLADMMGDPALKASLKRLAGHLKKQDF